MARGCGFGDAKELHKRGQEGWGRRVGPPQTREGRAVHARLGKGRGLSGTIAWRVDKSLCGDLGKEVSVLARI